MQGINSTLLFPLLLLPHQPSFNSSELSWPYGDYPMLPLHLHVRWKPGSYKPHLILASFTVGSSLISHLQWTISSQEVPGSSPRSFHCNEPLIWLASQSNLAATATPCLAFMAWHLPANATVFRLITQSIWSSGPYSSLLLPCCICASLGSEVH